MPNPASARKTQPSGLAGFRHAMTRPATPKKAEIQTGTEPPEALRL